MKLKKQVECITTGEVFSCAVEAGQHYGVDSRSINKCCRGQRKSAGRGQDKIALEWRYINVSKEIKNSQDGGRDGDNKPKLKASDFDLDFSKRKNKKFFWANVDKLEPSEVIKLERRMHERLSATEKSMRKEWKSKHLDMSDFDNLPKITKE
jgi:hypothetical protein